MIFVIDDKRSRQNDYGWNAERFHKYENVLVPVWDKESLLDNIDKIIVPENVILFHESFFSAVEEDYNDEIKSFRSLLKENSPRLFIAYFSGSKSGRYVTERMCMIPPGVLYENLEIFISKCHSGEVNLRYLAFGENDKQEEYIRKNLADVIKKNTLDSRPWIDTNKKNLLIATSQDGFELPFANVTVKDEWDLLLKKNRRNIEDSDLNIIVERELDINNTKFDAIYIPLYFGNVYSDYLGLRLALYIRLSDSLNRDVPMFIYGVSSYDDIKGNECFDVLKLPNVYLVKSDNDSLLNTTTIQFQKSDYRKDLHRIHLEVPSNIGDNHSVANRWAIYRWSRLLNDTDDAIMKNTDDIYASLYFRYLTALYPPSTLSPIDKKQLIINHDASSPKLNVLFIDDEADEGWYELMCHILYDLNKIEDFDYVGSELKSKTQDEIVDFIVNKIKNTNVNLVILDLRLHEVDFSTKSIINITGFKLLKEIKLYNRGIQVLMFSATNKIWNLQELQKEEVDGFIMKESPVNSDEAHFVEDTITNFVKVLSDCSKHTYRRELWNKIQLLKKRLSSLRRQRLINKEYCKAVDALLTMTEDALFSKDLKYPYATAFMNLFRIIEATSNEWIDPQPVVMELPDGKVYSYYKLRKNGSQLLKFNQKAFNATTSEKLSFDRNNPSLPYFQKICNTLHVVNAFNLDAYNIVAKRNNFSHPNLIENSEIEEFTLLDVLSIFNIVEQLIIQQ